MEVFDDDTLDPATKVLILRIIPRDIEKGSSSIGSLPNDRKTALLQSKKNNALHAFRLGSGTRKVVRKILGEEIRARVVANSLRASQ